MSVPQNDPNRLLDDQTYGAELVKAFKQGSEADVTPEEAKRIMDLESRGLKTDNKGSIHNRYGFYVKSDIFKKTATGGKIVKVAANAFAAAVTKGISHLAPKNTKVFKYMDQSSEQFKKAFEEAWDNKELDSVGSVEKAIFKTTVAVLGTLGLGLLSEEVRDDLTMAISGEVTKEVHVKIQDKGKLAELTEKETVDLPYNPKDKPGENSSIGKFMKDEWQKGNPKIKELPDGSFYMLETNPARKKAGISSFLFAPGGDFSKAESIQFFDKEGKGIFNHKEALRAVRLYAACYDALDAEWEKMVAQMANGNKELEEYLKAHRGVFVIDPKFHQARVLGAGFDLNDNPGGYFKGIALNFNEEVGKNIDDVYRMKHDEKLEGKEPHHPEGDKNKDKFLEDNVDHDWVSKGKDEVN